VCQISGAGKFLKEKKPSCQVVAIEPSNARVHVGAPPAPHSIVGIGAGIATHFLQMPTDAEGNPVPLKEPTPIPGVVDEWAHASPEEAIEFAKKACAVEGMMVGPSAGAALKVACDVASRPESAGKTLVVVCASHGIRYVAHPLWADVKKEAEAALPKPPNMDKTIECVQWDSSKNK
jgi:cysteine synthase A